MDKKNLFFLMTLALLLLVSPASTAMRTEDG